MTNSTLRRIMGGWRRAAVAGALVFAVASVVLPGDLRATTASWVDSEFVHASSLRTDTFSCTTDTNYLDRSFARFASGRLPGGDLSAVADVAGLELVRTGPAPVVVTPASSRDLAPNDQDPHSDTWGNPLALTALSSIGLDLSGFGVGLPVGSAGAVNQYAQVTDHGTSVAASGLVSDSGGIGVTSGTPSSELPQPATLSLAQVLPVTSGISRADLTIGAVSSSARLDWCAARQSAVWGDGSVTGVTRDYGVAGVGVRLTSPLVAQLTSAVAATVQSLGTSVATLTGTGAGSIRSTILSTISAANTPALQIGPVSGTVAITGLDLTTTVNPLLTQTLSDGVVSVDLATGRVSADLAALAGVGSLSTQAPNTRLTLTNQVLAPVTTRVTALLDAWITTVSTTLVTAVRAARLVVNLSVDVGTPLLGLNVLRLGVGLDRTIGDVLDGRATFGVTFLVLGGDLLGAVTALGNTLVGSLTTGLVAPVATLLTSALVTPVTTTLPATLRATSTQLTTAVSTVLGPLPGVVSVAVNAQPDRAGALPGDTALPAIAPATSAEYRVTALRIGLVDRLAPANGFLYLALGASTVGRNTRL